MNLPDTTQLRLMILLKYGKPNPSDEYMNRLPDAVVDQVFDDLTLRTVPITTPEQKRRLIAINLFEPPTGLISNGEKAIMDTLVVYHCLLETL